MNEQRETGVLVLSAVRHAGSYIPDLLRVPGVVIREIVEEDSAPEWAYEDARRLGALYHIPVSRDVEASLDRDDIDLVLVCSEPTRHARLAERALAAGRHVLLDKPFATSLDDATSLLQTAQASSGRFSMMQRLASPQVARARAAIDAGQIGLPVWIDIEWLASDGLSGEAVERPEFVTDVSLSGGGELMNFLTYPVSTLRYLTGLNVLSVFVEAGVFFFDPHRVSGVEDIGIVSLEMERGVIASLTVGRVPQAAGAAAVTSSMRVVGSHGHILVEEQQPELDIWRRKERSGQRIGGDPGRVAMKMVMEEMVGIAREGGDPSFSADDGWHTISVIDAVYRSMASGQPEGVATRGN